MRGQKWSHKQRGKVRLSVRRRTVGDEICQYHGRHKSEGEKEKREEKEKQNQKKRKERKQKQRQQKEPRPRQHHDRHTKQKKTSGIMRSKTMQGLQHQPLTTLSVLHTTSYCWLFTHVSFHFLFSCSSCLYTLAKPLWRCPPLIRSRSSGHKSQVLLCPI